MTLHGKAVVFGNGLIGVYLSSRLESLGFKVFNIGRTLLKNLAETERFETPLVEFSNLDVFIYAAGSTDIAMAERLGEIDIHDHLQSFSTALSFFLSRKAANASAFLISSGGAMYGENHETCGTGHRENSDFRPISVYGKRNVIIEEMFFESLSGDLTKSSLRVANPFHPLQFNKSRKGLVVTIVESLVKNVEIRLLANGSTVRNYFPLDLLGLAIETILANRLNKSFSTPAAINCGLTTNLTALECVNIIESQLNRKADLFLDPHNPKHEVLNAALDCSLLMSIISKHGNIPDFDLGAEFLNQRLGELIKLSLLP